MDMPARKPELPSNGHAFLPSGLETRAPCSQRSPANMPFISLAASRHLALASAAVGVWAFSAAAVTVTPADAMGQVGHSAKVCGVVASAVYEAGTRGHPTFVTLMSPDQPGANRTLTAVIYGTDLAKFGGTPD